VSPGRRAGLTAVFSLGFHCRLKDTLPQQPNSYRTFIERRNRPGGSLDCCWSSSKAAPANPPRSITKRSQCGLARDLDITGVLHDKGVQKAVASLERFVALSEAMGVERLELLATAAVRDASDGGDFAETLHRMFGLPVRV
jgi:exopolyphosphatase/guanosine-5'-triphosphate,3'-diphosphate pyrophosphatase